MTVLTQMQDKVDQMISERDAEIATLKDSVEKEKAEVGIAEDAMNQASDRNDLSAYQKGKKKLTDAQDALQMHEARLKKLESEPLISAEEYKSMLKELTDAMDSEVKDAQLQLLDASDQLASIGAEVKTDADQVNGLMKTIQCELFRNADRRKNDHGIFLDSAKDYRNHYDTINWADSGKNYYLYAKVKEGKNKE